MNRRLLVLDDDPAVGRTIHTMAERLNFEVRAVVDAKSFFETYLSWSPGYVVIDLVLPRIDGMEVLLELSRARSRARIVIVSGAGSRVLDAAHRAASESGLTVLGVLSKPFTMSKLSKILLQPVQHFGQQADVAQAADPAEDQGIDEADLRRAIAEKAINVVFQPKIRCLDLALRGFEALARWTHPTKGVISPILFIPLAEKWGLIDQLTEVVFEDAIEWLASSFRNASISMAVNISTQTLNDIRLADYLADATRARDIDPQRVILEVTETGAMADPVTMVSLATRLRLKGFLLSLDDFGIGHSSLTQLARLPFSEIKIDRSFVRDLETNKESLKIVKAIIALGHSLNLRVTAEGVEDAGALASLSDMRCDLAQGYFIGRPMTREAIADWRRDRARLAEEPEAGDLLGRMA